MAVKFRTLQRAEPGVAGGGTPKWYASKVNTGKVDTEKLSYDIAEFCSLSEPDVQAVIRAMLKLLPRYMNDGKIIELGSLGSFHIAFSSKGHDTEEEVSANSIYRPRIRFRPAVMLQQSLDRLKFSKSD